MVPRISGIYKITNKVNNKVYIGSSTDLFRRIRYHKNLLRIHKHINSHLQSAYCKYGVENFEYEIIEVCCSELLLEKEQLKIRELNSNNGEFGYNIRITCYTNKGIKYKKGQKEKFISPHKVYGMSEYGKDILRKLSSKPVCMIDKEGKLIENFKSIKDAGIALNIHGQQISKCCKRRGISAGGYYWCFKQDFDNFIPLINKNKTKAGRSVATYDIEGNIVGTYTGVRQASNILNISINTIQSAIRRNTPTKTGVIWKYKD